MKLKIFGLFFICLSLFAMFIGIDAGAVAATIRLTGNPVIHPGQEMTVKLEFANLSSTASEGLGGAGPVSITYDTKYFEIIRINKNSAIPSTFDLVSQYVKGKNNTIDTIIITIKNNDQVSSLPPNTTGLADLIFRAKENAPEARTEIAILNNSTGFYNPLNPQITYNDKIGIEAPLKVVIGEKLSNNARLESLTTNDGKLYPDFSPNIFNYSFSVDGNISEITLNPKAQDANATIKVIGDKMLKEGTNRVSVIVTATDGFTSMEYVINVFKGSATVTAGVNSESDSAFIENPIELLDLAKKENANLKKDLKNANERFIIFIAILSLGLLICITQLIIISIKKRNELKRLGMFNGTSYSIYDTDE